MDLNKNNITSISSVNERSIREEFFELYTQCPIPPSEKLTNISLFEKRQDFSRRLFFYELYTKILNVHGVIMEFGTRWGSNMVTLTNLRGILEPYNFTRKIIGFDTFQGFVETTAEDGNLQEEIRVGGYSVSDGYEEYLKSILKYHENESPLSHIQRTEVIKGDAIETVAEYLERHPETIIALAYFDFDLYKPTRDCLQLIKSYVTQGTILGFDELNDFQWPGETIALREVFGLNKYPIRRTQFGGKQSYLTIC